MRIAPARTLDDDSERLPATRRITTSYDEVLAAPDVDIVSDRDAQPSARGAGGGGGAGRQASSLLESRPASTSPSWSAFATRCGSAGVRTIVSFELRYNPFLKFARWLRTRTAGSARSASRARSTCRDVTDWVQRLGLGAHARERAQPPARRRLPRRRRAALVFRVSSRRRVSALPHALHRAATNGRRRLSRT